jgi:hypothetical protein
MTNELKKGDTVYLYELKRTGLQIKEGMITEICCRGFKVWSNGEMLGVITSRYKIGTVTIGSKLWLKVNDIDLARKLFIEHEEKTISKLQKSIELSNNRIKLLNESE